MVCCLYYPATTLGQAEVQLSHVFFEKDTEPYARQRDAEVLRMAEVPITSLLGEVSEVVFFFPASSLHGFMACPAGAWCACRCFAIKTGISFVALTAFWTYATFLPKFRPTSSWLHVSYQLFICFTGWIKWWSQHL